MTTLTFVSQQGEEKLDLVLGLLVGYAHYSRVESKAWETGYFSVFYVVHL